ncbi:MAG: ABC transporter permease [Clostridiales bacterium]|nr:ABC transporter permease [Clostridiales bacterium]
MRRSLKALIRKTFGKNHTMKSQASVITFLACVAFIFVVLCFFFSLYDSFYHRFDDDMDDSLASNIVMVNPPDSWKEYAESKDYYFWLGLEDKETDALFDVFTFSKWMKEYDAFMVMVFPKDFDEKIMTTKVEERPEILTFVSTDHLEYVDIKDSFLKFEFENYYTYISEKLGVNLPDRDEPSIYINAIDDDEVDRVGLIRDRLSRMVAPLLFFVTIMYTCMLIAMNAIAGEKERGTFAAILMTPMSRGTIVLGNFLGVALHAMIPSAVCMLVFFPTSIGGFIGVLMLSLSLIALMSAITIMISCMSQSIVSAQTAFLPIFLIVLVACVTCMQPATANEINSFIPIYGHFFGIGDCLMNTAEFLPVFVCVMSSLLMAAICLLVSRKLLTTEMFTVAVESKSDREIRKAMERAKKQEKDYVSRARANVFGYRPMKRKSVGSFLIGHAFLPLALLSLFQTLSMIPAIISYMKTKDSVRFLRLFRDLAGLDKVKDAVSESASLFSEFMENRWFIFFMGLGYWCIIGCYILIVKLLERNRLSAMGFSSRKELVGEDERVRSWTPVPSALDRNYRAPWKNYLRGLLFGFILISSVYVVMFLTGQVSFKGFALTSESTPLFFLYLLMWIPQGATEEIMMRGYMLPRVAGRFGIPFGIFFSSLCFSLMHGMNAGFSVLACINLMLIAALFACIALRQGHIYTVCAMHTIWNFCQGNLFGLEVSGNPQAATIFSSDYTKFSKDIMTGGKFGPEGGLCVTIVIAVAFLVLFLTRKKKSPAPVKEENSPTEANV